MTAVRLSLRCVPFSSRAFWHEVREASGLPEDADTDQVKYLISYLVSKEVKSRTLIVEEPYVDRHYLEEYTGYYASALRPPRSKATRIHVLSCELDDAELAQWIEDAKSDYETVQSRLQSAYVGFVVIRPFPSAPIGRTILRPYRGLPSRCFAAASTEYRVHLAGFELMVKGMPFQQQDQAVGACATTAIWSALARVMRADGGRAATPLAVTAAATKYIVRGRALPANAGLDLNQILGAIREFGYSPYLLTSRGDDDHAGFTIALKCYLRSGIPVILRIRHEDEDEAHAITVVGFRESDEDEPAEDIVLRLHNGAYELRSTGLSRLYVHDDRLGPYARAIWLPRQDDESPTLELKPRSPDLEKKFASKATVWGAIVPLYPKLRLSAEDLIAYAGDFLPLMVRVAGQQRRDALKVEPRFMLGGQYLRDLHTLDIAGARVRLFVTTALLSRYVGIIRFCLGTEWFADVICDTTDIRRDVPLAAPVLGMIPRDEGLVEAFKDQMAALTGSREVTPGAPVIV
ncbi:hypothetical protein [Sorangium sp. So ce1335]|uniref:hypothetical protein n=1 Tax=Sorangium sp. So ce1335 TaxID=3133335 RepID=UPI003F625CBC